MSLLSPGRRSGSTRLIALALASGVPLAAYFATASAHGYWLDGGELVAASVNLDIAHPPGHPLAILWGKLFCFLPFGTLAFRVALGQAVAAAIAAGFLFSAIDTTVRALGVDRDRIAIPVALGGTWLVVTAPGWWFQAVRPEVYALQAMLVCIAIERLVRLEAAWPTHDLRPLYASTLALGLGLANHHLVAFLVLPALAPTLARVYRARGSRPLASAMLGLCAYVYLPVRAATDPPANLGHPTDLANLWWVVSARVYAHHMGLEAEQPLGERVLDVGLLLADNLHLVTMILALTGFYAMVRTPGARRLGLLWGAIVIVNLGARAWLGSVRSNPDILGYMMPGLAGIGALATAFVGAVLSRVMHREDGTVRTTALVVALVTAGLGLAQLKSSADDASLARFHATDDFDDERVRRLPYRAVVIAHDPQTVFRHWSVQATERTRPDVVLVPMPFLGYPGMTQALADREPFLADLLRGVMIEGELRQPDLQTLATRGPLLVEMDLRVPLGLYETLVPGSLYYEAVDAGATETDVREAAGVHAAAIDRLYAHLGDDARETETKNQLLWRHYVDALYFAAVGSRDAGREAVRRGLAIQPEARELVLLERALSEGSGPLDVRPFLVTSGYE